MGSLFNLGTGTDPTFQANTVATFSGNGPYELVSYPACASHLKGLVNHENPHEEFEILNSLIYYDLKIFELACTASLLAMGISISPVANPMSVIIAFYLEQHCATEEPLRHTKLMIR